jgi:hypothetical protein
MDRFRQNQIMLDEVTKPGREDAAEYFRYCDKKYGKYKLCVPAVVQPQTDEDAAAPTPKSFGELMECLDIVPGVPQMPQWTSRPGRSHMTLGSGKVQSNLSILCLAPAPEPDSSLIRNAKPVELVSFDP